MPRPANDAPRMTMFRVSVMLIEQRMFDGENSSNDKECARKRINVHRQMVIYSRCEQSSAARLH